MATAVEVAAKFELGSLFQTYERLNQARITYEKENFVMLYERHSRTSDGLKKRSQKRPISANIRIAEVDYCCIFGGKNFKTNSKGVRPNTQYVNSLNPAVKTGSQTRRRTLYEYSICTAAVRIEYSNVVRPPYDVSVFYTYGCRTYRISVQGTAAVREATSKTKLERSVLSNL